MEIRYSKHYEDRLALRELPKGIGDEVFQNADVNLRDPLTNTLVAVRISQASDEKDMALVYTVKEDRVTFITIHPLKQGQMERRINSGRWLLNEP